MPLCLLVEDSKIVRTLAKRMVTELGYETAEAEDGQVALDWVQQHPMPDVVLLDWNMPVLDGPGFLKQLRQLPEGGKPVVIFCTTENEMGKIIEGMSLGANEYIMKPFDIEILRGKFQQLGLNVGE